MPLLLLYRIKNRQFSGRYVFATSIIICKILGAQTTIQNKHLKRYVSAKICFQMHANHGTKQIYYYINILNMTLRKCYLVFIFPYNMWIIQYFLWLSVMTSKLYLIFSTIGFWCMYLWGMGVSVYYSIISNNTLWMHDVNFKIYC